MSAATVAILLVEDSPTDAALLHESLHELSQPGPDGFRFTLAETWAEAAAHLQKRSFDVLLLDLSLSDSTGRDTFVRARAAAPHLPIVVLTGVADEAVGLEAVRHGIQDYLIKGQAYGRQTARAIRYAIERQQAEAALRQAEASLQRERDLLEARVQKRTAELSEANRALQAEIVQRERAEEAHRQVLRRLVASEETERGRVSRELHDRLGQDLTALKLGMQVLAKQRPCPPLVRGRIGKLEGLIDSLMRDIHRLAWELRPAALDDFGLEMALRRYANEWAALSSVPADLDLWFEAWLPRRAGRAGALVALIGVPPQPDIQSGRAHAYLETVARHAGLDYLPRERKLPQDRSAISTRCGIAPAASRPMPWPGVAPGCVAGVHLRSKMAV